MAIMTAAQARAVYLRGMRGDGEDATLDTLIARADSLFASFIGLPSATAGGDPTLEDVTYTLYLTGDGSQSLQLPVYPIQSVTTVHDSTDRTYGSGDLIDSSDYTVFGDEGLIRLDDDGSTATWSKTDRAIKVVAVVGWTTIPDGIVHACGLQVSHWYKGRDHVGRTNISQAGGSVAVKNLGLLDEVKEVLRPYRLTAGWLV